MLLKQNSLKLTVTFINLL